jgi:hypothetical protein
MSRQQAANRWCALPCLYEPDKHTFLYTHFRICCTACTWPLLLVTSLFSFIVATFITTNPNLAVDAGSKTGCCDAWCMQSCKLLTVMNCDHGALHGSTVHTLMQLCSVVHMAPYCMLHALLPQATSLVFSIFLFPYARRVPQLGSGSHYS